MPIDLSQHLNFRITGKITGKFFARARKLAWIAGFSKSNAQKQRINRELGRIEGLGDRAIE
jgi:hypothetical protein